MRPYKSASNSDLFNYYVDYLEHIEKLADFNKYPVLLFNNFVSHRTDNTTCIYFFDIFLGVLAYRFFRSFSNPISIPCPGAFPLVSLKPLFVQYYQNQIIPKL